MRTNIVSQSFTSTNAVFNSSGAEGDITGHVDKVVFKSSSWANGSVVISDVDNQAFTFTSISGTLATVFYPRTFAHHGVNVLSGANFSHVIKPLMNGPLMFSGIGLGSVTAGTVGRIDVYFE